MTALRLPSAKPQRHWLARLCRAKRGTSMAQNGMIAARDSFVLSLSQSDGSFQQVAHISQSG